MESRYIYFPSAGKAAIGVEEIGAPAAGNVTVKLERSTISSGTERANVRGDVNVSISSHDTVARFPRRSGYSSSGVITGVGEGVKDLAVGDRVALIWSSHGEYLSMSAKNAVKLPDGVSFGEAALLHIGTFPLAALRKCRVELGESVIVMGLGVLGVMAVKLALACGAAPVIAADPVKEKRELALSLGADFAFDPSEEGFADRVREASGGGVNVAVEVTGVGKALDEALDCMARMGRVALLGCTRDSDFTIDYYRKVHGNGVSLIGAHTLMRPQFESSPGEWTARDDVKAMIKLIEARRLKFGDLVSEVRSPLEAPEIYERLIREPSFPVVQFDWRKL